MTTRKPARENKFMREAGEKLRSARIAAGFATLQDAERASARLFGEDERIEYQQISRMERGAVMKPGIDFIDKIARTYGVPIDEVLSWYGIEMPSRADRGKRLAPSILQMIEGWDTLPPETQTRLDALVRITMLDAQQRGRVS